MVDYAIYTRIDEPDRLVEELWDGDMTHLATVTVNQVDLPRQGRQSATFEIVYSDGSTVTDVIERIPANLTAGESAALRSGREIPWRGGTMKILKPGDHDESRPWESAVTLQGNNTSTASGHCKDRTTARAVALRFLRRQFEGLSYQKAVARGIEIENASS